MTDIVVDDITNDLETGIFDRLMQTVNCHIDSQYQKNRITGSDYANVYLGSLQGVLQASIQYVLQEQLTEAQVDGIIAENLIKEEQLKLAKAQADREYVLMLASLDKEFGYDYTLDVDGNVVRTSVTDTADGKLDYENINLQQQGDLLVEQTKAAYTDRVLTDKQAAKLGLDNVMKLAEADRIATPSYTYTPRYEI